MTLKGDSIEARTVLGSGYAEWRTRLMKESRPSFPGQRRPFVRDGQRRRRLPAWLVVVLIRAGRVGAHDHDIPIRRGPRPSPNHIRFDASPMMPDAIIKSHAPCLRQRGRVPGLRARQAVWRRADGPVLALQGARHVPTAADPTVGLHSTLSDGYSHGIPTIITRL